MIDCRIDVKLNWHFSIFLSSTQNDVKHFYCRLLIRWIDDRVRFVKHFHNRLFIRWIDDRIRFVKHLYSRLLIRRVDDRIHVNFLYSLNAIERWILFTCRLLSREDDDQSRAIDEYEFAYEKSSNISKNTFHDLSDRIALSKQLQHHCHEQHTLTRTHNLLNRHEQWLHKLRVFLSTNRSKILMWTMSKH